MTTPQNMCASGQTQVGRRQRTTHRKQRRRSSPLRTVPLMISDHVRPLVIIPARFSASASALRYDAEVAAAKLLEAVWDAGGEPLVVHPTALEKPRIDTLAERFWMADAVLAPAAAMYPRAGTDRNHIRRCTTWMTQDAFDLAAIVGRSGTTFRCSRSAEETKWSTSHLAAPWCRT